MPPVSRTRVAFGVLLIFAFGGAIAGGLHLWRFGALQALLSAGPPAEDVAPRGAAPIPPGRPLRLAAIGTSLTSSNAWPERLVALLESCRPEGVALQRVARAGAASDWGERAVAGYFADASPPPDIVIMEFAINDASLARGVPLSESAAIHRRMLAGAAALRPAPIVFLTTMNPAWGGNARERPGLDAYFAMYRDLARETGGPALVDVAPDWRALSAADRGALVPDGLHPTDAAQARVLVPRLFEALRPWACPDPGAH